MADEGGRNQKGRSVPLLPVLGFLTMIYAWMLEFFLVLGHRFSGGQWPAPAKFWVVTGIAVVATLYKLTLRKEHRRYDAVLWKAQLDARQVALILCFVMGWVALGVWLACGPPGPEFRPA